MIAIKAIIIIFALSAFIECKVKSLDARLIEMSVLLITAIAFAENFGVMLGKAVAKGRDNT